MAVAFRANGHMTQSSASSTGTLPASLAAGDVMLMCVTADTAASTVVNTPSGWTAISSSPTANGGFSTAQKMAVFYRVAGASETAPTVTFTVTCQHGIDILAFTGCDGTTPINANAKAAWIASNIQFTYDHPSVTTTVANCGIVLLNQNNDGGTVTVATPPAGYSQIAGPAGDGFGSFTATLGTKSSAGATGTLTATYSNKYAMVGYTVALAPLAAVAPVADFTGTPLSGTEPLSVTFTDASTNTPTSWAWTFGDGGTSSSQNPTHSYTAAGTYTVALVATNSAGSNTKTRTGYIVVSDQPRPIRINTSQGWADIGDATSFVSGTGTPTAAVGATGAVYLNTATGVFYGPKAGGAWPGTPVPGEIPTVVNGQWLKGSGGAAVWAAISAADVAGGMALISDQTLGASASSIQFASIPQTYKHLLVVASLRSTSATYADEVALRLNGDSGGDYTYSRLGLNDVTAANISSGGTTQLVLATCPAASSNPANFGAMFVLVPNYADAAQMQSVINAGYAAADTQQFRVGGGLWTLVAAVTTATLFPTSGQPFAAGSRATLYGLG